MAGASRRGTDAAATVAALDRGIAILRCFGEEARVLSHGEIALRTNIPKATVTRLVATLITHGLLRHERELDKYALSAGVLSLARSFLAGLDVRGIARPHMAELAEACDGWVYLAVRDGEHMVLIETCRAPANMLQSRLDVGSRLPLATSSLGRAYLSALEDRERSALMKQVLGSGARRIEGRNLARSLEQSRRFGYCQSLGEWHPEINTVAVAIRQAGGEVMAINCGGPSFAFGDDRMRRIIAPKLLKTARRIAQAIGGSVPHASEGGRAAGGVRSREAVRVPAPVCERG